MRAADRGRDSRGGGSVTRKNLITASDKNNQQEKKQRIENACVNDS